MKHDPSLLITDYGLACYPLKFHGYVVSPTKICLQYENVQVKLRRLENSRESLKKHNGSGVEYVYEQGTDFKILATGTQMPELEEMHMALLEAYEKYLKYHTETYEQTYNKKFSDHLLHLQSKVNRLVQIALANSK